LDKIRDFGQTKITFWMTYLLCPQLYNTASKLQILSWNVKTTHT